MKEDGCHGIRIIYNTANGLATFFGQHPVFGVNCAKQTRNAEFGWDISLLRDEFAALNPRY